MGFFIFAGHLLAIEIESGYYNSGKRDCLKSFLPKSSMFCGKLLKTLELGQQGG